MKNTNNTNSFRAGVTVVAVLLAAFLGTAFAQNPYPDYDFKAANADGDTLYYRITSATAPYTVAVTRCHDSVYHTLPHPQYAWEVGQPGFLYPVYDYDSLITIPSSVTYEGQTYTVNAVDKEAFYMQKGMHTVILPASVTTIDSGAFYGSTLHQIGMSPNVTHINYYAFMSTPLESIDLPSCLTRIGEVAFYRTSLTEVEIPAGVTVLPYDAFAFCPLTKISFHEGLQEIQRGAFSANYIDSLVFPRSLRKIALMGGYHDQYDTIFCRYVQFQTGTDPLELSDYCFLDFTHLETLILSDNIVRLGESCFEGTNIQSVSIPPLVDTIPEECFADCGSLSSVTLPQQLSVIERQAFIGTSSLREISFPASLTVVGKSAFVCPNNEEGLKIINCYGEIPPSIVYNGSPSFNHQDTIFIRVPCGTTAAYQSAPGWSSYQNLVYEECVGVEDHEPSSFTVYPNPAGEVVHVELEGAGIANVALYDLQGRVVTGVCDTHQQGTSTINLRNVPGGIYLLRVTDTNGKEYQRKIIKNV